MALFLNTIVKLSERDAQALEAARANVARGVQLLERLAVAVEALASEFHTEPQNTIDTTMLFKVKADNPDVTFNIDATVRDSEGNVIEGASVDYEVTADNPEVVEIVLDDDNDPSTGVFHFGAPGVAGVAIKLTSGSVEKVIAAQFIVTAGDPADISVDTFDVVGLTPEPEGVGDNEPNS